MPSAAPWMVSGCGTEVPRRVAAQVDGGVGGRDLDDLVVGEGVDDVERDRGRRRTDDHRRLVGDERPAGGGGDRHVGRVTGVLDVVAGVRSVHATRGVDLGDGETDAGDLGRAEEGEVARQRQDAADGSDGLAAGLVALALVVGEAPAGALSDSVGDVVSDGSLVSWADGVLLSSEPQAASDRASTAVPAMTLAQVTGLVRLTGWDLSFGCTVTAALDPRGGVSGVTVNRQRCGTAHRTLSLANRYVNHRHGVPAARDETPLQRGWGAL